MLDFIIIIPGICVSILASCGRFFGSRGAFTLAILALVCSFVIAFKNFLYLYTFDIVVTSAWIPWCSWDSFSGAFTFWYDILSLAMACVVLLISCVVHSFAFYYLEQDPHRIRFFTYLLFFTVSMLVFVLAGNYISLFFGWELVGICSYLLINFWSTRITANRAALKAIFVNKVGDIALLVGIVLLAIVTKTTEFSVVFSLLPEILQVKAFTVFGSYPVTFVDTVTAFFLLGALGKSAQLGFQIWLTDAMEGPTPVSALLHAATMVTAGVFLILRSAPLFINSSLVTSVLVWFGAITALFAAFFGLLQYDIKKIIALSTCSQLGYMFLACGLSEFQASFFHLVNHAFFKALLFLIAGIIIHHLHDTQDLRRMGGLATYLPIPFLLFFVGSSSLGGFPYLSGHYSKDFILDLSFLYSGAFSTFLLVCIGCGIFCTTSYSLRLFYYVFFEQPCFLRNLREIRDTTPIWVYLVVGGVLVPGSFFSGYLLQDCFIGSASDFALPSFGGLTSKNSDLLTSRVVLENEFIQPVFLRNATFVIIICSFVITWFFLTLSSNIIYLWIYSNVIFKRGVRLFLFFLNLRGFFDLVYNTIFGRFLREWFVSGYLYLDKGFLELLGPRGVLVANVSVTRRVVIFSNGSLRRYIVFCSSLIVSVSLAFFWWYLFF